MDLTEVNKKMLEASIAFFYRLRRYDVNKYSHISEECNLQEEISEENTAHCCTTYIRTHTHTYSVFIYNVDGS